MITKKELFLNSDLRCGGFYELCIQVCKSENIKPIKEYTDFIWNLKNVDGPFDKNFNIIEVNIENMEHQGILNLGNYSIPFKTFNIREENPIETGYNWFDISFYAEAIEKIFGEEYTTWTEIQNSPKLLTAFFHQVMKSFFEIHNFELAMIDYEVSGQYYFSDLKSNFENYTSTKFYIAKKHIEEVAEINRKFIIVVD